MKETLETKKNQKIVYKKTFAHSTVWSSIFLYICGYWTNKRLYIYSKGKNRKKNETEKEEKKCCMFCVELLTPCIWQLFDENNTKSTTEEREKGSKGIVFLLFSIETQRAQNCESERANEQMSIPTTILLRQNYWMKFINWCAVWGMIQKPLRVEYERFTFFNFFSILLLFILYPIFVEFFPFV